MSSNMRELTDRELDGVGGGHHHNHHGGISGLGALSALRNLLGSHNTFINDVISIVFNFGQMNGNGTVGVNNGLSVGGFTQQA